MKLQIWPIHLKAAGEFVKNIIGTMFHQWAESLLWRVIVILHFAGLQFAEGP